MREIEEALESSGHWHSWVGERAHELRLDGNARIEPKDGDRYSILIEENAEVEIFENGAGQFAIDILLHPNAKLRYLSASTQDVSVRRFAYLEKDAQLLWIDAAYGKDVHSVVTSFLAGEGSDAQFKSVFLGKDRERYDIKSEMIHSGDKSTSDMLTRAVLLDESKGRYEGLIRILDHAKGCDAYQKEETLLLSEGARMDATPNLEISNEDVRCSHGVSLGQIDEEKLFYFEARGIPAAKARSLIVQGFFDEILDKMGERGAPIKAAILERSI